MVWRLLLVLMLLVASGGVRAAGVDAGHVGLTLAVDDYGSETFRGGHDGSKDIFDQNVGGTLRYVREPTGALAWLPAVGIGISRWRSGFEGNCCGFEGETVDATYTTLDLMAARISTRGDVRLAWYLLGGVTSADIETGFDTDGVAGITAGSQSGYQIGFGFFSGEAGGFSGGFDLRFTRLPDFDVTTVQMSVGMGF